jgi:site-specific DNA-methyltransferase (adenine-specific)
MIQLFNDDCLKVLPTIPDESIDLILTDPPYGTTQCKWDSIIPFEPMWKELKRIVKEDGAIALFGSEPFSSALRMSNIKNFKYDWIWKKSNVMGFLNAKKRPLKETEIISIFNSNIYKPQNLKINVNGENKRGGQTDILNKYQTANKSEFTNYPRTIIEFKNDKGLHPTQKPIALLEYLIKTYTNEGDTVLDFTMGSGSTGVACKNINRKFIGIEMDKNYFDIAKKRIEDEVCSRLL